MNKIQRQDIQIISRHSSLSVEGIDKALKEGIYSSHEDWRKFLHIFFISLGLGFTVAGLVFFFAYNWDDLHKFAKIGLTEFLIIVTTGLVLFPKINLNLRNIILTASSVMVGVMFAVYGQIYQTGANAYDFFLGWTIFVSLWVIVSKFPPLWLVYLTLINTTLILYTQQVAKDWSVIFVFTLMFIVNSIVLITAVYLSKYKRVGHVPNWLTNIVALAAIGYATIGINIGIFDKYQPAFPVLILLTVALFGLGIWHGLRSRNLFYLAVIPFSLIIIISALLIKISAAEFMFLLLNVFIISSVTLVIKKLIALQKEWKNEK